MCGYRRQCHPFPPLDQLPDLDLTALDTRLTALHNAALSTTYTKQKISLENEFVRFLSALPAPKMLFTAVPLDVCRFLVWKDKGGQTQVHHSSCPHLGLHGVLPLSCHCPIRLSHKTVDSLIGKQRALFQSAGRQGDWNLALRLGNHAASLEVKQYLKAFTSEQLQAAVTPQQATPLFVNKLLLLSRHIQRKMGVPDVAAVSLFTFARDHAFFQTLFFSGD